MEKCLSVASAWGLLVLVATLPGGCAGQSGAEVLEGPDTTGRDPGGAVECRVDAECRQLAAERLASLGAPVERELELSASRCESLNVILDAGGVSGPACQCDLGDDGTRTLGPAGIGCSVLGRGGDCLFGDADFEGCSTGDDASCEASCEQVAARLDSDAARVFQTNVLSAVCRQGGCDSVVEIDDRCYVNDSASYGRSYDCSLETEALLEAERQAQLGALANPLPTPPGSYVDGTLGTFWLTVSRGFVAGALQYDYFSASAQFAVITGEDGTFGSVVDPLEGVDDCGVTERASVGFAPNVDHFAVDEVSVSDGSASYPLALNGVANERFFPYGVGLSDLGVEPRFSRPYSLRARGGQLDGTLSIEGIVLPADLAISSLEGVSRVERGPLELHWVGTGSAPLQARFWINPSLGSGQNTYEIECLIEDDGEFTIPVEVLEAAPEGFVTASFRREHRELRSSGDDTLLTLASIDLGHDFALGAECDGSAVMAACESYAEVQQRVYAECGVTDVPPRESTCPAYLAESCQGCVEYFECAAADLRCEDGGLYSSSACGCP